MNADHALEVCRDRVAHAAETRSAIRSIWNEYIGQVPRRFVLKPGRDDDHRVVAVETFERMPVRLSTLFGEWLYELRAALDGAVYFMAVRDSGQNPPPAERGLMFPTFDDAAKFDDKGHRGRLKALSDNSFALLRQVQPFNAQPDQHGNVLWWLDELARIDRHRYGHALASHADHIRVGVSSPLVMVESFLPPNPTGPLIVDEAEPVRIIEVKAPSEWDGVDIQQHLMIDDGWSSFVDVPEWRSRAAQLLRGLSLDKRMYACEIFVLDDIIEPLVTGTASLPQPERGEDGGS
ncbi:hypothetical protein D7316_00692 [Gordonia insulae]|uniref:Uncharacterized protein n=2 Tax=Gordonia insulae TaxID=2420509 RepID=A0A3G8JHW8_9ACTN|nr:hypothetical protein D7316_00692 [Gordonia insulae]